MKTPQLHYDDVVKILPTEDTLKQGVAGKEGVVRAISCPENEEQEPGYAVQFDDDESVHFIYESALEPTGRRQELAEDLSPSAIYSSSSELDLNS